MGTTAHAHVFQCPDSYPGADVALNMSAHRQGEARLQPSNLSMAYMYVGELYGEQYLVGPDVAHSTGQLDIQHGFRPEDKKWLVCVYGGNEWSGSKERISGPVQPQPWKATAECK